MMRVWFFGFIVLIFLSCRDSAGEKIKLVTEKYIGFWAETEWSIHFISLDTYVIKTEGHLGNTVKTGKYLIKDSLIVLLPDTEYFDDLRSNRLKKINSNCLMNYWGNFYCRSIDTFNAMGEKRYKEEQLLEKSIEELHLVKKLRYELNSQDSTKRYSLSNRGMIQKDNIDYFEYQIVSLGFLEYRSEIYLKLYTQFDPIRIFDRNFNLLKEIQE